MSIDPPAYVRALVKVKRRSLDFIGEDGETVDVGLEAPQSDRPALEEDLRLVSAMTSSRLTLRSE